MGPKRSTHRHKSSVPASVLLDYTPESQAQQTRSGYARTILLMHPKPSSRCDQHNPPHRLLSTSVPLISLLSRMLLPSCFILPMANSATAFSPPALSSAALSRPAQRAAALLAEAGGSVPGVHRRQLSLPHLL